MGDFFISICMNTYLVKGPLIELSLGGKKEEKKGKVGEKEKVRNNCACFAGE